MKSAKYIIKLAIQAIQKLDLVEDTCRFYRFIQERMQNNGITKTVNVEIPDISLAVNSLFQHSQLTTTFLEISF